MWSNLPLATAWLGQIAFLVRKCGARLHLLRGVLQNEGCPFPRVPVQSLGRVVVLRARKAIGHSEGGLFTRARLYYFVDALWYYARELIVGW